MKNLIYLLFTLSALTSFAQDKIVKTTGDVVNCSVSEIGSEEIKYFYESNPKIVFGIEKSLVDRIEFSTGEVVKIENNSFDNADYYTNQSKHALKFNFMSPLMGSSEFAYEQHIKPGKSWETALGIIGLGFDTYDLNAKGVYGKFAFKFIKTPDFYIQKMRYAHILKGGYIAPEVAMRYVTYDDYYYDYYSGESETTQEEFAIALTLKFGKQWVFDDSFLVDTYLGFGYGMGDNEGETVPYGFLVGTSEIPMAFTWGMRIGWAF